MLPYCNKPRPLVPVCSINLKLLADKSPSPPRAWSVREHAPPAGRYRGSRFRNRSGNAEPRPAHGPIRDRRQKTPGHLLRRCDLCRVTKDPGSRRNPRPNAPLGQSPEHPSRTRRTQVLTAPTRLKGSRFSICPRTWKIRIGRPEGPFSRISGLTDRLNHTKRTKC